MLNLLILAILLTAGPVTSHPHAHSPSLPSIRQAPEIIPHSTTTKPSPATRILKRDECTGQTYLYPRKDISPPPPRNRGFQDPRNTNPALQPNSGGQPGLPQRPLPINPQQVLNFWRGNPPPPPLNRAPPELLPERARPLSPTTRAIARHFGAGDVMMQPHDPIFFGRPASSLGGFVARGH